MVISPQILVFNIINQIARQIKRDISLAPSQQDTVMWRLFSGINIDHINFAEQAIGIFSREQGDPRELEVSLSFDEDRANLPTIHVMSSNESEHSMNLGVNENYQGATVQNGEYSNEYARIFDSSIDVVITSNNTTEVTIIHEAIKAMMLPLLPHLSHQGFQNVSLSARDLMLNSELIPPGIFMKSMTFRGIYCLSIKSTDVMPVIGNLFIQQITPSI